MRRLLATSLLLIALLPRLMAQGYGGSGTLGLRTNLAYDALVVPTLGVEYAFADRWSLVATGSYIWLKNDVRHRYWRIAMGDLECRYWLGDSYDAYCGRGHHVGLYGGLYRYDIEFGGTGNQSDLSYGGGISYGYAFWLSSSFSLDLSLGLGYMGGKFHEYEPEDGHYYWNAEKMRHFFGPTKVEVTLVWHLDLKGGLSW